MAVRHRKSLGVIGLGAFGRFMAGHLSPWFDIVGCDRDAGFGVLPGVRGGDLGAAAACDAVVFAVPLAALEEALVLAAPAIKPGALVLDVTSVKIRPVELLARHVPSHAEILATHPLFGPQSGRDGIEGLRIALCPVRVAVDRYCRVRGFLADKLRLEVLKVDPDQHDREMARVQAMTHFMSRALREIGLAPSPLATRAYEKLQEFSAIVLSDSWDLFLTIQKGNPYADGMRRKLIAELTGLEKRLAGGNGAPAPVLPGSLRH